MIADQSVNYVERFIIDEGHTTQRVEKDYGYDLLLFTFDNQGYAEPGLAFLQLKASEALKRSGSNYVFDLDVRDFHRWMLERSPVFLILCSASRRRAYWLHVQGYFEATGTFRLTQGAKSLRVRIPARQAMSRAAVAQMRQIMRKASEEIERGGGP